MKETSFTVALIFESSTKMSEVSKAYVSMLFLWASLIKNIDFQNDTSSNMKDDLEKQNTKPTEVNDDSKVMRDVNDN